MTTRDSKAVSYWTVPEREVEELTTNSPKHCEVEIPKSFGEVNRIERIAYPIQDNTAERQRMNFGRRSPKSNIE